MDSSSTNAPSCVPGWIGMQPGIMYGGRGLPSAGYPGLRVGALDPASGRGPVLTATGSIAGLSSGLALGFLVAAQVGPIWLLCARTALRRGLVGGLAVGLGAALVG